MTFVELLDNIKAKFQIAGSKEDIGILNVEIEKSQIRQMLSYLKDELKFDYMFFTTALDWPANNNVEAIYYLFSYETKDKIVVRAKLDRNKPEIDTVSDIYRTAEWHERETAEMFGINYINHPDLRPLLTPDGLEGYPLRKDFKHENLIPMPDDK